MPRGAFEARVLFGLCAALAACGGDDTDDFPTDTTSGGGGFPASPAYAALPVKADAVGAARLDDHLYVLGGHTGGAHDSSIEAMLPTFLRLDLNAAGAQWEQRKPLAMALQQGALFVHEGRLHRLGGLTAKNHADEPKDLYSLADLAVYDVDADSWQALAPMPDTRASHDVVQIGDTLYVIGGWKLQGPADDFTYHTTWLSLDLAAATLEWKEHPQPFEIRDHCGGAVDGKVWVLGGMRSGTFPTASWVYDPASDSWSNGPDIPASSLVKGFGCAAASADGTLYFTAAEGVVYRLNAARDGWDEVARLATPRAFHRLVARGAHELIAVGGAIDVDSTPTDSVESIALP